ncbi:MAG: right-handed parallel beta-helix repeat-containing protein [Candidatus Omnitrophica bacterium]|nr:right-handed parallel beta-helix repeat-containing protein [Candidatus Omnitrophota bacterium]
MELKFYVAKNGDDKWSGNLPSPNKNKDDGPFLTLERVMSAVRKSKEQISEPINSVTVYIRAGTYFLTNPLTFTPENSGIENCSITFTNYKKEKVVISGGRQIDKWEKIKVNDRSLWAAKVPEIKNKRWYFRQLWVNGKRQFRTRYPQKGYLKIEQFSDINNESEWKKGQKQFQFKETDLKENFNISDTEIISMTKWVESRSFVTDIDKKKNIIFFDKLSVFKLYPGDLYYLENIFDLLKLPQEWYLNKNTGILYYLPPSDIQINKDEIIAPVISQIIRLEGEPEKGKFIENIIFKGLIFSHTEWLLSETNGDPFMKLSGFDQADIGVPGAIYGRGVRNCAFVNCCFTHLGTYAIELVDGCSNNKIVDCQILDLGAGGIKIGESIRNWDEKQKNKNLHTYSNFILNCQIYDGGIMFHSAVGIWIGQSYKNYIGYNHIHDFYYSGLSIGWTWGYGPTLTGENIVEFNNIHHIGILSNGNGPILSDMGGIYTLGIQRGTIIRYNILHDIYGLKYGGWGIYLDEGSSYIVAENNLVYNTTHGGFHQHYGKENIIRNNIFVFGRDQQIQITRAEKHLSFTFEHNIVCYNEGKLIEGNTKESILVFNNNLYWNENKIELIFGDFTFSEWQNKGMDKNSIIANPFFVSLKKYDFRLKQNSPASKIGFKSFLPLKKFKNSL